MAASLLERAGLHLRQLRRLVKSELRHPAALRERLAAWRQGYRSRTLKFYDQVRHRPDHFLTDWQRFIKAAAVNGPHTKTLDNKLLFHTSLAAFPDVCPVLFATAHKDHVRTLSSDRCLSDADDLMELIRREERVVAKPLYGGHGHGFRVFHFDRGFFVNGQPVKDDLCRQWLQPDQPTLIMEFVSQHRYASDIFPETTNTIRILTMYDEPAAEAFIAIAVHRFGTRHSRPTDTFENGGAGAEVDLDNGTLGMAASIRSQQRVEWTSTHPETAAAIAGVSVPNWSSIAASIRAMATALPQMPYIGWDVVVTGNGFRVLEGNSNTSMDLLQVHRPLLADRRVRDFFRRHKVL